MGRKPNVVLVLTDDQGYGDLSCHGNPIIATPNIDAFHGDSVRLTDYHVGPTCAPTRAGIFTGHFHNSTGVWHTIGGRSLLRRNEVSLASVFKDNGYRTGIFGKWHLGDNYPYRPHDRGFEEAVVHGGGGIGQTPDFWGNDYFDDTYFDLGRERPFKGYCTDVFFSLGEDFIKRHKDEPFLCVITTNAPHGPLHVAESYAAPYRGKVSDEMALFYGMIANIDENFGALRRRLIELKLEDDTILIFMTDNGTATGCVVDAEDFVSQGYNAGMRGRKGSPYDGGHRVPLFLRWKNGGFDHGRDIADLVANVDLMPTLLDLCGLPVPEGLRFDGVSLKPLLAAGGSGQEHGVGAIPAGPRGVGGGENTFFRDRILVTDSQRLPNPVKWKDSAAMQGSMRLVRGKELYDISADPEQRHDMAAERPEVVSRLRAGYEEWWSRVSVRFDEEIPIVLGSEAEMVTDLTSHDIRGDSGDCAWNQGEVRQGKRCKSYWEVELARAGRYRFELRRWPREDGGGLRSGKESNLDLESLPYRMPASSAYWYLGGKALAITGASISIADAEASAPVDADADSAVFRLDLPAGPSHLEAYFTDDQNRRFNPYYVYASRE